MTHATALDCLARLRDLRGKEPAALQALFDELLDALLASVPTSRRHLDVLETMREPLDRALGALSQSYAGRPVPPAAPENATLLRIVATWTRMADAYGLIAQDTALGNSASTHCSRSAAPTAWPASCSNTCARAATPRPACGVRYTTACSTPRRVASPTPARPTR